MAESSERLVKFVIARFDPDKDEAPRQDEYEIPCIWEQGESRCVGPVGLIHKGEIDKRFVQKKPCCCFNVLHGGVFRYRGHLKILQCEV